MDILEFPQMKQCMDLVGEIYETWALLKMKLDELDKLALACKPVQKKAGVRRLSSSKVTVAQVFDRSPPEKILGAMAVASPRKEWLVKDLTAATGYSRDEVRSTLNYLRSTSKVRPNSRGRYEVIRTPAKKR